MFGLPYVHPDQPTQAFGDIAGGFSGIENPGIRFDTFDSTLFRKTMPANAGFAESPAEGRSDHR